MKLCKIIKKLFGLLAKILVFAAKITAAMQLFNWVIEGLGRIRNCLHGRQGNYYEWKHGKIFYTVSGHGTPVVIIHGLKPGDSGLRLLPAEESLSREHTVYNIDLLGFGKSDKPWITYTNYIYVLLIRDFLKNVVTEKADICAFEGSGLSVLQAKKVYPDLIGSVTLINPCTKESIICPRQIALRIKKITDLPVYGTFVYNLYCLLGKAPLDKDTRHVFVSRLTGHLTTNITNHKNLITDDVVIKNEKKIPDLPAGDLYAYKSVL